MPTDSSAKISHFKDLALPEPILMALEEIGYEAPSPIQIKAIPCLLAGHDLVGQAQTGTGKTAAFALPILARINTTLMKPQALVLTPTRELALQVSQAFERYGAHIKKLNILSVYGGQDFRTQLQKLQRGAHIIVGTPGRIMDHIQRQTLRLDSLQSLILDEADEMLRMGFIEDVQWILERIPEQRQSALFSATMPKTIAKIAREYLRNPTEITVKVRTKTSETVRQRYWSINGVHKLDALTRILEIEDFDGSIVFTRTKTSTNDLCSKLNERGFTAIALNGDIPQHQREQAVEQFKNQKYDILVATDVAARGLDVDRITHVINYDIPYDPEAYIHRIGRTGRAGRSGEAILFVAPRERRLLKLIESATHQRIEKMTLPSVEAINHKRKTRFQQKISDLLTQDNKKIQQNLHFFKELLTDYQKKSQLDVLDIAAALAQLLQKDKPFLLAEQSHSTTSVNPKPRDRSKKERQKYKKDGQGIEQHKKKYETQQPDKHMERFQIAVGKVHGVKPSNIVGAIANEAGLSNRDIGSITIEQRRSLVDLPKKLPKHLFHKLNNTWICGQKLKISRLSEYSQ